MNEFALGFVAGAVLFFFIGMAIGWSKGWAAGWMDGDRSTKGPRIHNW